MIRAVLFKKLDVLTFFVTNRCNCKCRHCFFWKELNKQKGELSLEEIRKITEKMGKLSILYISGGEPMLRKDLAGIIKLFYENCGTRQAVIPSNGIIPAKSLVKEILESCPKLKLRFFISIDAIGKKHDQSRRFKGAFDAAMANYRELKKIRNRNFKLGIGIAFTKLNEKEMLEIYRELKGGLSPDFMNFPIVRGDARDKTVKEINIELYRELMEKVNSETKGELLKSVKEVMSEISIKTFKENKYLLPCYACRTNAVLYANGDVFPCELLQKKVGNIRGFDYDFKKLWRSENAKEIRAWIKDKKCFCLHGCNLLYNIAYNPVFYPKIASRYFSGEFKKRFGS